MGLLDPPPLTKAAGDARYPRKQSTRVGMMPFTAPNTTTAATALDLTQRSIVKLPFAATGYRLGFRNQNLRSATPNTTPATITGVWTGTPARNTSNSSDNRWNGNFATTPTQVAASPLTVPTDGSYVYTPWITSDPIAPNVEKLVSWGLTTTATGSGIASGNGYQGCSAAGSTNAGNTTLTSPVIAPNALYLDVKIEYQFAASVKVILFVGDSLTVMYSSTAPPLISGATASALPHESWPMAAGAMGGFAAINIGVGSALPIDFASNFPALWTRTPVGFTADAAVVSLGTNGLGGGLPVFQTQYLAINAYLRGTVGINTLFWTTLSTRSFPTGSYTSGGIVYSGQLTTALAAGATTVTMPFPPVTDAAAIGGGSAALFGLGPNAELRTVSSYTGTGPYVWTFAAGLVNAHNVGEPICMCDEKVRRLINNYIRQTPDGISGVVDFERLLEASPGSFASDDRLIGGDYLHFTRGVAATKAAFVIGSGVQPAYL